MGVRSPRIGAVICSLALATATMMPTLAGAQVQDVPPWRVAPIAPPAKAGIIVGETPLEVELAVTPAQQSLGLGYRNGLEPGTGMLFVDDSARMRTFWMKGMRFCLDIVWVQDGTIVGAAEAVCPDPAGTLDQDRAHFASPEPVTDVLEVPAGWLQQHGYGTGTAVEIPASILP